MIVESTSYATLGVLGALVAIVPFLSLLRERRAVGV